MRVCQRGNAPSGAWVGEAVVQVRRAVNRHRGRMVACTQDLGKDSVVCRGLPIETLSGG